jgi:hypothetical protein
MTLRFTLIFLTLCEQIYVLTSILVWGVLLLSLLDSKYPVWYPYYGSWFIALASEGTLLIFPLVYHSASDPFDYVVISIQSVRVWVLVLLLAIYFGQKCKTRYTDDEEVQPLISDSSSSDSITAKNKQARANGNGHGSVYGSTETGTTAVTSASDDEDSDSDEESNKSDRIARQKMTERLQDNGNWWTYAKSFSVSLFVLGRSPAYNLYGPSNGILSRSIGLFTLHLATQRILATSQSCSCRLVSSCSPVSQCLGTSSARYCH